MARHFEGPALTEVLHRHGYTHRPAVKRLGRSQYARDIVDGDGDVVATLTADEAWQWLREMGLWPEKGAA